MGIKVALWISRACSAPLISSAIHYSSLLRASLERERESLVRSSPIDNGSCCPAFAPPARCILRIRLPPAWTPDEDARLQRLAKENGFRHWYRVARQMPRRSYSQCRDRWRDDDELARLHQRLGGARWKDISRAVYGRSSRVMKRRWRDLRKNATFLRKMWRPLPAADQEDVGMDADLDSPASSSQHPYTGLLASCSLSRDTVGSGACTSLAV